MVLRYKKIYIYINYFFNIILVTVSKIYINYITEQVLEANLISEILDEAAIPSEQAEMAAVIIQNAYRHFKEKQARERNLLHGMVDWRVAASSTLRLYRKTGATLEEVNRAATLIKVIHMYLSIQNVRNKTRF